MFIILLKAILLITSFFIGRYISINKIYNNCNINSLITSTTNKLFEFINRTNNCVDNLQCPYVNITLTLQLHHIPSSIPKDVFTSLHHPATPAKWAYMLTENNYIPNYEDNYKECNEIYLTRSGQRTNQPNKCYAVAKVPKGMESIIQSSHRIGVTALTLNQYQKDFPRDESLKEEESLIPPLINNLLNLKKQFISKLGSPIDSNGKRKDVVVMVANEGVMDLVLNFICSAESINFDLNKIVVFVGNLQNVLLIESMGAKAIYNEALGVMPSEAAKGYLDHTFGSMMWFKTTSVFLALQCGYNVLFQDADLVWMKDPLPHLNQLRGDILFMDDGARTPRYTPLFVNSGFYYVKYNNRTLYFQERMIKSGPSEIGFSHSHQQVLTKQLAEALQLFGLQIEVLDILLYPSGQAYHENKKYLQGVIDRTYRPYVFHMCWTDNRVNKVVFFKEINLWYLPERPECIDSSEMLKHVNYMNTLNSNRIIRNECCLKEKYWPIETVN